MFPATLNREFARQMRRADIIVSSGEDLHWRRWPSTRRRQSMGLGTKIYLWASLPGRDDSMEFAKAMLEQKVILAPCAIFSPNGDCKSTFSRFNVGYLSDARFPEALQRAS